MNEKSNFESNIQDTKNATVPRILIIEDNALNLEVLSILLNMMGLKCDQATSGHAALILSTNNIYDLVLMDLQMPDMDGFETCRRIRSDATPNQNCKIVAVTAHVGPEWHQRSIDAGMNDFLSKPIRRESLATIIKKHTGYESPA
jgi:CheY-like chemotaxis protein